jgi:hypothetical protein
MSELPRWVEEAIGEEEGMLGEESPLVSRRDAARFGAKLVLDRLRATETQQDSWPTATPYMTGYQTGRRSVRKEVLGD